jgi:cytochrome c peroxidase
MMTTKNAWVGASALLLAFAAGPASGQGAGTVLRTPDVPMELPIEVEIELSPAGSLKQALLWKEFVHLLENPQAFVCPPDDLLTPLTNESHFCEATIERRPGFGVAMPNVNIYSPGYNFLTGQPLRVRTSDGEVSWDQPGPLFDPDEIVATDAFNAPTQLRTVIGHLVACPDPGQDAGGYQAAILPDGFCDLKPDGSLVVHNPSGSIAIPEEGTVVAVEAFVDGVLHELVSFDPETGTLELEEVVELELPVNEEDFLRDELDVAGVPATLQPYVGRLAAEVLGKALFWDMQVGSDGIQACGSCHFHGGVDNRTRNQLNPNTLGGDLGLDVTSAAGSPTTNVEITPADFPFHKGLQDSVANDANDVLSSMGVSRFKQFVDIPPVGLASFLAAAGGVRALAPDLGTEVADPVPVMQGVRRVEPRNTPTFHGAAFNFDNFWDGRARFAFNGGSVFGPADPTPHIFINTDLATSGAGEFTGATMGHLRPDLLDPLEEEFDPEVAGQPVRMKFSSLGSQAVGPPLSDFEMSFAGRNWAKIGKKLLQGDPGVFDPALIEALGNGAPQQDGTDRESSVVPLANQLVAVDDSRLGEFSNQGGSACTALGRPTAPGMRGLCISYPDLIRLAFGRQYWNRADRHLDGTPCADPFDGYCLAPGDAAADDANTSQFTQMEANFSLFFALAVQAYEALTIPDHTPLDRFFDVNPHAGHAVGEPGDQAVLFPTLIPDLLDDGELNGTNSGTVTLIPDDPSTPWYDGFGPDELFGFDVFAGGNLTAGLAPGQAVDPISGINRNPLVVNSLGQQIRVGSNPFTRSAKCMLCHLGPEQTDHSINIAHGILKNDGEFEYPTPPSVPDPTVPPTFPPEVDGPFAGSSVLPAPEPSGKSRSVVGLILAEEVGEGVAQDAVEVEPRDFQVFDDPATPWDDRIVAQESNFAFGDQGVYNIGVRPIDDDVGRGGADPFGWPLSLAALTLMNIAGDDGTPCEEGGPCFTPCDGPLDSCTMSNFDPFDIEATFEETGDGALFPGSAHGLQSINPGFERDPITPLMPEYMIPWIHSLPAGELHPQIDEMAGMVPNTVTAPNGGPAIEFPEILFGADFHCASYDPAAFGMGPPNFGWGPPGSTERLCPQHQSGAAGNLSYPAQGTWPVPNRVMRNGAFKAPPLRNVELTGPYFHTGSYLTLRQVVDFYVRGGDFPRTNADSRDPHVVNLDFQAFAFGPSQGGNLLDLFDCSPAAPNDPTLPLVPGGCGSFSYLAGSFGDGLPDTAFLYDAMPDTNHPISPEYATREDAKTALVRFLLALTDPRVKLEQAPFDHPEIFVPIDGAAPENTGGATQLAAQSLVACDGSAVGPGNPVCFRRVPAVGAGGRPACDGAVTPDCGPLGNFLGVGSTAGPGIDHFDQVTSATGNVTTPGTAAPPTLADALRVLQIAAGLLAATTDDLTFGDVAPAPSGDGALTIADALIILRAAAGLAVL